MPQEDRAIDPQRRLARRTPSTAGFDPAALEALTERIRTGDIPNVHAVLVEHADRLVFERYFAGRDESWGAALGAVEHGPDTLHDLRSVTKSVTSALLGIEAYYWHCSPAWPRSASPSAASGRRLRARDLAKIASLFLHRGAWQGRQIVPSDWIARSTERHVRDVPGGPPGVFGYGYFWYPGELGDPGGLRVIRAVGIGDQRLFVAPDRRVAVTVFAGNYNDFRRASGDRVFAALMAARTDS